MTTDLCSTAVACCCPLLGVPSLHRVCALVNMDLEYRKKWDSYVSKLEVLKEYKSGHQLLYWQVSLAADLNPI